MKAAIFKRFEQSCWISNKSSSVTISCLRLKCFIWHNNSGSSYRRDWFRNISEMFFVCLFVLLNQPILAVAPLWQSKPRECDFFCEARGGHRAFCTSLCVYLLQCHCNSAIHPSDALVACSCVWLPGWSLVYMLQSFAGESCRRSDAEH